MFGFGQRELIAYIIVTLSGEIFTVFAKWAEGKEGLGWKMLYAICAKLARVVPTFSDLKRN